MMRLVLGERLYEKKSYPKYTQEQMNRYVILDCPAYTHIKAILNIKCWLKYGCYMDKATKEQSKFIEDTTRGFYNYDANDLFNMDEWDYTEDNGFTPTTKPKMKGLPCDTERNQ